MLEKISQRAHILLLGLVLLIFYIIVKMISSETEHMKEMEEFGLQAIQQS